MTVYLLWTTVPKSDLLGIFETQALAQTWLDSQMRRGAMTRGEHDCAYIEPWPVSCVEDL